MIEARLKGKNGVTESCATHTADGRVLMLGIDAKGALMGALRAESEEPRWVTLTEKAPVETHIALHARDGRMVAIGRQANGEIVHRWFAPEALQPWAWERLDGSTTLPMALVERKTGGIEAFMIDMKGVLWHRWSNRDLVWSDWSSLESEPCVDLCVVNNREGFPQTYVRLKTGGIAVRRHLNDGTWKDWINLGGSFVRGPMFATGKEGYVKVFAADEGGQVWSSAQFDMDDYTGWERAPETSDEARCLM